MKYLILTITLFFSFQSVDAQYIPPHRQGVSQADYDKWVGLMKKWNKEINDPTKDISLNAEIALFLNYSSAHFKLKEPVDSVYFYLEQAMKVDKESACARLNSYNESADYLGYAPLYQRITKFQWETLMEGCDEILAEKEATKISKLAEEYEVNKKTYNFELIEQLTKISAKDISVREEWSKIEKTYGKGSPQELAYIKVVHESDSLNLMQVEAIIKEYGYPGKSLVGSKCETYAMWVIHHAKHNEFRKKYFPILYKAVIDGELEKNAFKLYIDRLHQIEFGTQLYGSQSRYNSETKTYERSPIEDEENFKQRIQDYSNGIIDIGRLSL